MNIPIWRLWWTERIGCRDNGLAGYWPIDRAVPTNWTHTTETLQEAKQWMVTYFFGTGMIGGFSVVLDTAGSLTELLADEDKHLGLKAKRLLDEISERD